MYSNIFDPWIPNTFPVITQQLSLAKNKTKGEMHYRIFFSGTIGLIILVMIVGVMSLTLMPYFSSSISIA